MVDLPGVYSLGVTSFSSIDERIARDFALSGEADLVVNIVDASNLERNLYLTAQIIEMRVPMIVALNMMDIARSRRVEINVSALAARLGCPVVPLVASRGEGAEELKEAIFWLPRNKGLLRLESFSRRKSKIKSRRPYPPSPMPPPPVASTQGGSPSSCSKAMKRRDRSCRRT